MPLPVLAPAPDSNTRRRTEDKMPRQKASKAGPKDDHAQVVRSLCKTYTATSQKLMYVFATLLDEEKNDNAVARSVDDALHASSRSMMLGEVTSALAAGIEKVLRSTDLSLRSTVLRDLRARFVSNETAPKVETAEKGSQATRDKSARSSRPEAVPPAAAPEEASKQGRSSRGGSAPPRTRSQSMAQTVDQALGDGEEADASASATATEQKLPPVVAIYDRLKAWELRKAARVESERKAKEERESRPSDASVAAKESRRSRYAHVPSTIKIELERQKEDDARLAATEARLHSEVQAREQVDLTLDLLARERVVCAVLRNHLDDDEYEKPSNIIEPNGQDILRVHFSDEP